jgi:uncharacterized protein YdcH (DUF465 family)
MKIIKYISIILIALCVIYGVVYGAEKKKAAEDTTDTGSPAAAEGGGGIKLGGEYGKGTEPMHFDDNTLIATPVPTVTPIIKVANPEKKAWEDVRNTRDLIKRCETDLPRYEKFMRREFMSNLNEMQVAITTIHTYALLHKRDEVEYVWGQAAGKGEKTLATCEDWVAEFRENLDSMNKNQYRVDRIVREHAKVIQQPGQIMKEWEVNKREMFWAKKKIDYFENLFEQYVSKYNQAIKEKDALVEKLLSEHQELHKP